MPHDNAAEQLYTIIRNRRSIKPQDFNGQTIDRKIIERLIDAANWAPTHGLTEPWRFVVFEQSARQDLGQSLQQLYRQQTSVDQFKQPKYEKMLASCQQASCVLAIVMKRQATRKIPEIEEVEAVACAVQNLHLMATALGVAGYWSSGSVICSDSFRDYLGFDTADRVLGLFYLGYSNLEWPVGKRGDWREKVTWFQDSGPQVGEPPA